MGLWNRAFRQGGRRSQEQPASSDSPPTASDAHSVPVRPVGDDKCAHFSTSLDLDVTPEVVWELLTTPEKWAGWYHPMTDVSPDWSEGAEVRWARAAPCRISTLQHQRELGLFDGSGTWRTWELSSIPDGRTRVTLRWDRRTPLSMQAAFEEHKKLSAELGRFGEEVSPSREVLWELALTDSGDSSTGHDPFSSEGTLLASAGRVLHCITPEGSLRWSFTCDSGDVPKAVAVRDGLVILLSLKGWLRALDTETGVIRWMSILASNTDFGGGSLLCDDRGVFVTDWDGFLYALDADSGSARWSRTDLKLGRPALVEGRLCACQKFEDGFVALDPDSGELVWSTSDEGWKARDFCAAEGVIYTANNAGLTAVDASTGAIAWRCDLEKPPLPSSLNRSAPVLADRKAYIRSSDHSVCCVDCESHELVWRYAVDSTSQDVVPEEPVVGGGVVYCKLGGPLLYAIDVASGSPIWSRSVVLRRPTVMQGVVYMLLTDRRLVGMTAPQLSEMHAVGGA